MATSARDKVRKNFVFIIEFRLCLSLLPSMGVNAVAIVAVKQLCPPGEAAELIVEQRHVAKFEIQTGQAPFPLSERGHAVRLQQRSATILGFGIQQPRYATLDLPIGP